MTSPSVRPPADAAVDESAHILVSQDGPVLTVTLNRPEVRNAQLPVMWEELARIGLALRCVPDAELEHEVGALIAEMSAALPGATRETKALLRQVDLHTPAEQRVAERRAQWRRIQDLAALMQGS